MIYLYKNLAAITTPVAFQNLLTTTVSMVDTMMVAPLGEMSVGALGLCSHFLSLMFSGYWELFAGGGLFISQKSWQPFLFKLPPQQLLYSML